MQILIGPWNGQTIFINLISQPTHAAEYFSQGVWKYYQTEKKYFKSILQVYKICKSVTLTLYQQMH